MRISDEPKKKEPFLHVVLLDIVFQLRESFHLLTQPRDISDRQQKEVMLSNLLHQIHYCFLKQLIKVAYFSSGGEKYQKRMRRSVVLEIESNTISLLLLSSQRKLKVIILSFGFFNRHLKLLNSH